jgi:hypothetical protein
MLANDIVTEVNHNTLPDSFARNLIRGKLWLALHLLKFQDRFDTIYVLGSWYGNMAMVLSRLPISYQQIVNVDLDADALRQGQKLNRQFDVDGVKAMRANANDLDYRRLGRRGAVINTSVTNMSGAGWFDNIPPGTTVAMLARDNDPDARNQITSVKQLTQQFPLSDIQYQGQLRDQDPETDFDHLLVIGRK